MKKSIIENKYWVLSVFILSIFLFQSTISTSSQFEEDVSFGPDPMIGEIMLFGGDFPPSGWAFCEGQLLSKSQYGYLHSKIGYTFGGDNQDQFALPDLRDRVPVGVSSSIALGQKIGTKNNTVAKVKVKGGDANGLHVIKDFQNHDNTEPSLKVKYIIALQGS